MSSEASLVNAFAGLDGLCKAEVWPLDVAKVRERPTRMEAIFYGSDGYQALEALRGSHLETCALHELASVVWPGVFSRRFVPDLERGVPFLSTSAMMEAKPKAKQFLSIKNTRNLSAYLVREGTILVSRSGTVGNVALVTEDMAGHAVSEDALRVHVRDPVDLGVVYCYLQSALGQFLLKRSQTGSVVRHLYEADVANLPIPKLPLALRRDLTERIRKISALRVKANRSLDDAERTLRNNFPELPETAPVRHETGGGSSIAGCQISAVSAEKLRRQEAEERYARLDAKFLEPTGLRLRESIKTAARWAFLGDIAKLLLIGKTFIPGVNKVECDHGVGYFTGKELFRTRRLPEVFIGGTKKLHIDKLIVRNGNVLVTCAGTAGKVAFVGEELAGKAVTHDAIRIMSKSDVPSGYLYAFLSSEFGRVLLERCTYGSVHSRLHDTQLARIPIPIPADSGAAIAACVENAFLARAQALRQETEAISKFTDELAACDKSIYGTDR